MSARRAQFDIREASPVIFLVLGVLIAANVVVDGSCLEPKRRKSPIADSFNVPDISGCRRRQSSVLPKINESRKRA